MFNKFGQIMKSLDVALDLGTLEGTAISIAWTVKFSFAEDIGWRDQDSARKRYWLVPSERGARTRIPRHRPYLESA